MAKGFKHGAGGGAALNFKVVGGTNRPADPGENTIWVSTEAKITGWIFSVTEPTEPAEGMAWFTVEMDSGAAFNALKKNDLQVYPAGAKQYVSGAWTAKTAEIYQSGAWSVIDYDKHYLFNYGDVTEKTGGWVTSSLGIWEHAKAAPSVTANEDGSLTMVSSNGNAGGSYYTVEKISLDGWNKLCFAGEMAGTGGQHIFGAWNGVGAHLYSGSNHAASVSTETDGYAEVDVSSLNSTYYILFFVEGSGSITIKKVWLE